MTWGSTSLSAERLPAPFIVDKDATTPRTDTEWGGVALSNPEAGNYVQLWTAFLDGDNVCVKDEAQSVTVLFTQPGVTRLALAFDQNMKAAVAYEVNGTEAYFRYYDTANLDYATITLPAGAGNVCCTLDDQRLTGSTYSDVLLAYVLDNNLVMRIEREKFATEHVLQSGGVHGLIWMGMMDNSRMGFQLLSPYTRILTGDDKRRIRRTTEHRIRVVRDEVLQ